MTISFSPPSSDAAAATSSRTTVTPLRVGEGLPLRLIPHVSVIRDLPGGARVEEAWPGEDQACLQITGELDAFDQHALIDLLTGCFVEGAHKIVIDAGSVRFADLDVVGTLEQLAASLERLGVTVEIVGLDRVRELLLRLSSGQLRPIEG